ncbi:MAG: hypothetical protein RIB98_08130 [Acidimicrobiales bacterium]
MTLTPRQMLILLVLVVGFGVTAFLVSRDGGDAPTIDEAAWCEGARGLVGVGPILTGDAAEVDAADLDAALEAFYAVETIAPFELRPEIGRMADFTLIAGQELERAPWPEAYIAARANKEAELDGAIDALETEMNLCGLQLG